MSRAYTDIDLEAYLDEALPAVRMAEIEKALRKDKVLRARTAAINGRRDAGVHSLGEIWRRERLTCPTREQLGSYLLGALDDEQLDYIEFHLRTIGCRYCLASYEDLDQQQQQATPEVETRRRKYFQSSAGHLRKR